MAQKTIESTNIQYVNDPTPSADGESQPCCRVTISPYPVYLGILLYFIPYSINRLTLESITYNKLCYIKYENISLCTDSTFTKGHPDLQVSSVSYLSLKDVNCEDGDRGSNVYITIT